MLLLTLFFRHFPQLVQRGHIFVARPPLFRVDVPAQGKRPARRLYCLDDDELDAVVEKLADGPMSAGRHDLEWNAQGMPAGLYFYRVRTAETENTGKLVVAR